MQKIGITKKKKRAKLEWYYATETSIFIKVIGSTSISVIKIIA